jgi:uncharacterized protein
VPPVTSWTGAAVDAPQSEISLRDHALSGRPLDRVPGLHVIDGHCHLGPYAAFYQPGTSAGALVRTMDRIGIAQACVFSTLAITIDMRAGNDLSLAAASAFPDRMLAYAVPDPNRTGELEDELERCYQAGARGIKLHTQLADYPFDGPAYGPVFAFADAHRLPLISHGVGAPDTLRRIALAYPQAHFIVAHAGAGYRENGRDEALVAVVREVANVYLDITSSAGHFGAFAAMVGQVGAAKLTYGSDMPWMCASHQVGRVLLAHILDEDKRRILGGNLTTLLATRR